MCCWFYWPLGSNVVHGDVSNHVLLQSKTRGLNEGRLEVSVHSLKTGGGGGGNRGS